MLLMMIKLLDYYYLVWLRHFDHFYKKDRLSYSVPGIIACILTINLFSLIVLFNHRIIEQNAFLISIGIISIIIYLVVDIRYNKKRRERLRQEYRRESRVSRQRGVRWVVAYVVLSIVFLILVISIIAKFYK